MKYLRAWLLRLTGLFAKDRREREIAEEIQSHLQMHIDDNLRLNMTPEEARRTAVLKLGGVEATKEAYRDRSTVPFLEYLLQDVRFAIRQLHRNAVFTCTAVLVLALGISGSVAIFSFVDAALIKPLPFLNPNRLVSVTESVPLIPHANLSYLDYIDWKKENQVFSSFDVYHGNGYLMNTPTGTTPVPGASVSDGFFRTLAIVPMLGRDFYSGEDLPGRTKTVLLSFSSWQKRFGGKRDVVGQAVTLDGVPYTVIGVLPESFQFAPRGKAEFWTTVDSKGSCESRRSCHNLDGVARLKDGVSVEAALANVTTIARRLEKEYPDSNRGQGASLMPLSELVVGEIRPILVMLLSGAGLLLLIACVNVASLLLVRSEARKRELAVRVSLGASSLRLFSQFVTEALVLVGAGSAIGVLFAHWGMRLLKSLIPADMMAGMPYLDGVALNLRTIAFAAMLAGLTWLLLSVTPALGRGMSRMREGLAEGSRGSTGNTWHRVGSNLVVVELCIAMLLLTGAGLLGKSLYRLLHVDLGFQADHLATMQIVIPEATYKSAAQQVPLVRRIVSSVSSLPGVSSAAVASQLPVTFNGNTTWIRVVGHPYNGEHNEANERDVSAGYFTALEAKLLRGRLFTDAEDSSKPPVVIVNRALAAKYFGGEDPIGKQIGNTDLEPKSVQEIIGVIDDIREGALDSEIWPAVYHPYNQDPGTYLSLVVRTAQSEETVLPAVVSMLQKIDGSIATMEETTMADRIGNSPAAYLHRSAAYLVGGFAAVALLLVVVGFYGVVAYAVGQRTREIGVRMALGAQRGAIFRLVLKEAGWLAALGILAGLICSVAAATLVRKLLFGVSSWDLPTLIAVASTLGGFALLASYVPARRAASLNPVDALHAE